MTNNTLTKEEIALAKHCLAFAQEEGAQKVRITLSKTLMNLIGVLNGEVDKTAHALDRSLQLQLFVDGKFGTFSSNRMEQDGLEDFIREAIGTVRMLQADACRAHLPGQIYLKPHSNGAEQKVGKGQQQRGIKQVFSQEKTSPCPSLWTRGGKQNRLISA